MKRRVRLLRACARSDEAAAAAIERARRDPVWFINNFGVTYDPRNLSRGMPAFVPFELYDAQVELVRNVQQCREELEGMAVPKSRTVGATWTLCGYSLWCWLFEDGAAIGWGSRKEDLVDEIGNPDSIFEKLRILYQRLPAWFFRALVPNFDPKKHDNHMRLINPDNGATIIGECGDNIGRGGRKSVQFIDESAHLEQPQKVNRAVMETTECLIDVSTPNGIGNMFERKVTKRTVRVFWMRWNAVPWRDEAWLDATRAKWAHDPAGFEQEIMCNFALSRADIVIPPHWVEAAINYNIASSDLLSSGYDVAETSDRNVWIVRGGPVVLGIEQWTGLDTTQSARRVTAVNHDWGVSTMCYDAIGVGAGVTGELANAELELEFEWVGVKTGEAASDIMWPNEKTSREWLRNLRAELWWLLRERFRKTYENQHGSGNYQASECISIPDHPDLVTQLSWPVYERTSDGRILIEPKPKMKKRLGTTESCDHADALCLAFADDVMHPQIYMGVAA